MPRQASTPSRPRARPSSDRDSSTARRRFPTSQGCGQHLPLRYRRERLADAARRRHAGGLVRAGSHPLDLGVSPDGQFLYNLTDGLHRLSGFAIGADGTLTPVGTLGGLPVGAEGIAVS